MKSSLLIVNFLHDIVVKFLPAKKKDVYRFAFIVHPRSRHDVDRKFPFFKYIPDAFANIFTKYFWPLTLSRISGLKSLINGKELEGYVISILPTAHQMVENRSLTLRRITQASILAKKKGVSLIGLGGLASSFSNGGTDLIGKVDINITTGHAYTSYNVTQNVFALVKYMNFDKRLMTIGIVGAAGSIGSTCAKLLAREGFINIILIDLKRKKNHFDNLVAEIIKLNPSVKIDLSHQIGDIKRCDIIIAATNAPEALIQSGDLKWGAIVVDDAQPSDVHPDVFARRDVLVIEAGVTKTPHIYSNFNFGLKNKQDNFCCLAEVFILAANEWKEHFVINRASLDLVDQIAYLGNKLNFKIAEFQNFNELITDEKLQFVKNCINKDEFSN